MKFPQLNRKHLHYFLQGVIVALALTFFIMNSHYSEVWFFGLFYFSLPNAILWLLFLATGAILGYLFAKWERRKRQK
jgi:uncharacterized integral membrane protein